MIRCVPKAANKPRWGYRSMIRHVDNPRSLSLIVPPPPAFTERFYNARLLRAMLTTATGQERT